MKDKVKTIISRTLVAFALISIGFAIGKEFGKRQAKGQPAGEESVSDQGNANAGDIRVVIYYMHATIRCVSCNQIETMARDLVEREFSKALADKRLTWEEVNYQEREDLAKRYNVVSSTIVVVRFRGEHVEEFRNLDQVWTLYSKPAAFDQYLGKAIAELLEDRQT